MTIDEIVYRRVTEEEVRGYFAAFEEETAKAACADDVIAARNKLVSGMKEYISYHALANVRFTRNTNAPFYKGEVDYYDEIGPKVNGLFNRYYAYMLDNPYRKEVEERLGSLLFRTFEVAIKAHSDDCIAEEQEQNALTTQYSQMMSSMTFEWKGELVPLPVVRGKLEDKDPEVRKEAASAIGRGLKAHEEELDDIFDKLVKVRTKIARKMGYADFVELGYYCMGRVSYDRKMVEAFRKNVVEDIVPVVAKLKEGVKRELGLEKFLFSDNDVYTKKGNPTFDLTPSEAFAAAQKMYDEMDGEIGKFFAKMVSMDAFDVLPRDGKVGGGYCESFPLWNCEFILANFNGTTGDADVLTHEFGHAYAMHASSEAGVDFELGIGGMETAECHSMSMEFLSWPFMQLFFGDKKEDYCYKHLADALSFIPYGCIVDEFQHVVYSDPDMTPAQRKEAYLRLEEKYRPYLSYEGIPYLEEGARWQYQMHIYESPFYYIDYCLAQTVALGFLVKSRGNYAEALEKYKQFARSGGSLSFDKLVERAEIAYPFGEGTLKTLAQSIEKILSEFHKV